jgi:hypothetical protein
VAVERESENEGREEEEEVVDVEVEVDFWMARFAAIALAREQPVPWVFLERRYFDSMMV